TKDAGAAERSGAVMAINLQKLVKEGKAGQSAGLDDDDDTLEGWDDDEDEGDSDSDWDDDSEDDDDDGDERGETPAQLNRIGKTKPRGKRKPRNSKPIQRIKTKETSTLSLSRLPIFSATARPTKEHRKAVTRKWKTKRGKVVIKGPRL